MEIQPGLQNFTVPNNLVSWCPNGHSAGLPTWSPGPALPTTFASSCASTELAWRKSQPHFLWDWCGRNQEPRKKLSADESMFNRRNKEEIWFKIWSNHFSFGACCPPMICNHLGGGRGQKKTSRNQKTRTLGHRFLSTFLCFFNGKGTWLAGCFCCARSSAANGLKVSHTNAGKIQPVIDRPLEQSSSKPFKSGCLT